MVKQPQSVVGYSRDGVVYKQPPQRHVDHAPSTNNKPPKKLTKTEKRLKRASLREEYKSFFSQQARSHPGMVQLTTAAKQGQLGLAIERAYMMSCSFAPYTSFQEKFSILVQILFTPDMKDRSAFYYAAHAGHCLLVKTFLSYLVVLIKKRRSFGKDARYSFQMWLKLLGNNPYFGPADLRWCVSNSLNRQVKDVVCKKEHTMEEIFSMASFVAVSPTSKRLALAVKEVNAFLFRQAQHSTNANVMTTKRTKKKKSLPMLNTSDDFNPFPEVSYIEDYFSDECSLDEDESIGGEEEVEDEGLESDESTSEQVIELEFERIDHVDEASELSYTVCGDSILDVDESDWELMSETSSVVTFTSETLSESYAEVLRKRGSSSPSVSPQTPQDSRFSSRHLQTVQENTAQPDLDCVHYEDEDVFQDAHFFVDGVKGARGGHSASMFKGNARTSRYNRRRNRRWMR